MMGENEQKMMTIAIYMFIHSIWTEMHIVFFCCHALIIRSRIIMKNNEWDEKTIEMQCLNKVKS